MDRILLATDFSTRSDRALRRAALIADASNAAMTLLHVVDEDQPAYMIDRMRDAASMLLEDAAKTVDRFDRISADMKVAVGDPASAIVEAAEATGAALIVLGPHRRTMRDLFVGTTAERVIALSTFPVLMANGMPFGPYERTFLALDMDETSRSAARAAQQLALLRATDITAMHIFEVPALGLMRRASSQSDAIDHYVSEEESSASQTFERFLSGLDLPRHRRLLRAGEGPSWATVLDAANAEGAELIVIGIDEPKRADRLLKRCTATEILRKAEQDVLAVPARGDKPLIPESSQSNM